MGELARAVYKENERERERGRLNLRNDGHKVSALCARALDNRTRAHETHKSDDKLGIMSD